MQKGDVILDEVKEKLEIIKKFLIEKCNPQAIILFGSYARNTQNKESDIDIAIKTTNSISKLEMFNWKNELEDIIKLDVDLINLDAELSDGFRYEILINGQIIFCQNQYEFDLYKLDMFREYLELSESRQMIINQLKEGESKYGE